MEKEYQIEDPSQIIIEDPSQNRTIKNIRKTLHKNLHDVYGIENPEVMDSLLSIHGLNKNNFDFVGNLQKAFKEHLNDMSIDDNSNKNEKTMNGIVQEVTSPINKALGYDMLYQTMREMYGKKEAKRLSGEMYSFALAISDSTQLTIPYCWSLDASKIVLFGRKFGQLHSSPPKRIDSYIATLSETVHQMSNHLAGALAIGTFFYDISHILLYKQEIDFIQLKKDKTFRKYIKNEFQTFIHSVNHLSRGGQQSPFSNISIFDSVKIQNFIKEMEWYFPGVKISGNNGSSVYDEEYIQYIVKFVLELQNLYMDVIDKGDLMKDGMPYRFPVNTINISTKKKIVEGEEKDFIMDRKFLTEICKRDIYRYNIFASEGSRTAACCRLLSDSEMLNVASQSNSFGGGSSFNLGSHRVITVNFNRSALEADSLDGFFSLLDKRVEDSAKILKAHKELIKITNDHGLQIFIQMGWINMSRMFSTFGILGEVEAVETLYSKFKVSKSDIKYRMIKHFNEKVLEKSSEYGIIGNIEQIPGESMAARLVKADKILFGEENVPFTLYSNQFVPLWKKASIWERLEEDGKVNQLITGGGIVHAQIGEKVTSIQAKKIIKYAVGCGCEHFALNPVYSECVDGHTTFGKFDTCPVCGKEIDTHYTRVVGFFTPVKDWKYERREWEFNKRKFVELPSDA